MHVDADGSIVSSGSMMPLTDSGSEAFPFSGRFLVVVILKGVDEKISLVLIDECDASSLFCLEVTLLKWVVSSSIRLFNWGYLDVVGVLLFCKRLKVSDNFSILASNFAVIASASSERFVDVTIIVRYLVGR
ncbi:uncharacterized protein OCT59_001373 [Rhizophagus irregularis]|uniref:uncharacterized protein n=1 Tax=Rhizophagus irregularis TaxID=588596 RepID=UPI003323CAB5|nr:hypothetical protein OCT59_001373 [Rhizophagus irregularis]